MGPFCYDQPNPSTGVLYDFEACLICLYMYSNSVSASPVRHVVKTLDLKEEYAFHPEAYVKHLISLCPFTPRVQLKF